MVDINVDLGEGIGVESVLMPLISSCNIACGGHAGNTYTMRNTIKLAKTYKVKIGAHPSFPDIKNFGRRPMNLSSLELFNTIKNQISNLVAILDEENAMLHHIKPHGALYNMAATDEKIANIIVEVLKQMQLSAFLYVPCNSLIAKVATDNKIPIIYEAFADRNYNDDLTLVPRGQDNALLIEAKTVFQHIYRMISKNKVKTITNTVINIKAETFCIHGDNPNAIEILQYLQEALEAKEIYFK